MLENINMNFDEKISINTSEQKWIESPSENVLRIPLERAKAECGHTTSVVKYLEGAQFDEHTHPFGEEIFVLEGTFSDENADYPAGSYIRNPPGTSHSPFSLKGCKIFVKLDQFDPDDLEPIVLNTNNIEWLSGHGGLMVMPLHTYGTRSTALVKWPKGEKFVPHRHYGGEEIFVLSGTFKDEHGAYPAGSWLRSPHLSEHHPWVDEETIIFVKTGHLNKS